MPISDEELSVISDQQFLLQKHLLTEKVISYFAEIERALHQDVNDIDFDFPKGTFLKAGKISKGEQYKQLPYFILDYPRLFTKKEIFAFRTMLWWGNELSCTLQLSGPVLERNKPRLIHNILQDKDVYFCVNEQPWDYYFEEDNYKRSGELSEEDISKQIHKNGFIKVSDYIPLSAWDRYKSFSLKSFARFLRYFY